MVPPHLLARARAVLAVERLWPAVVGVVSLGALFLAVSWLGLWVVLPPLGRLAGVVLFLAAAIWIVFVTLRAGWPDRRAAIARLDRDSGLPHRPVAAADDQLANAAVDPTTRALWELHRRRLRAALVGLKIAPPSPRMVEHDRFALRAAAFIAVVAAAFVAGPEKDGRLAAAFAWQGRDDQAQETRIDGWLDPPGYTGRPPSVLFGAETGTASASTVINAPSGSVVVVRASGPGQDEISGTGGLRPAPAVKAAAAGSTRPAVAGTHETRFTLVGDGSLSVARDGATVRTVTLKAIPDTPPRVTLVGTPKANARGSLSLSYSIADDYGVIAAEAHFANPIVNGHPVTGRSLVEAPRGVLGLPPFPGGLGEGKTTLDLSDHPWAGAEVSMTLTARDEGGNTGESSPTPVTLPAKPFTKPLARALVEQRRNLVLDPDHRGEVAVALDALQLSPETFDVPLGVYLGLYTASVRLAAAKTDPDLLAVADYLWQMALQIENGDLSRTEQDLRAAQKALKDAMERGASAEEIKKLTEALRQQMDKFLSEMMQNGQRDQAQSDQAPPRGQQKSITDKDLKSLMDRMEEAARNGDMAEAQRLLDQLNNIMENLKTAKRAQGQSQATRDLNKSMNDLDKMMREQGDVRDKTFQKDQGQAGEGSDDADEGAGQSPDGDQSADSGNGQDGQQGQGQGKGKKPGRGGQPTLGELQGRQQALRQQLQDLQKRLRGLGMKGEQGLADAEGAMGDADQALGRGDAKGAVEAQGRALEGLQKGSGGLQQQMAQGGQDGTAEGPGGGEDGNNMDQGEDTDPLGRPRQGRGSAQSRDLDVSGGLAARAQQVLEELRRRLGDPTRSQDEQDYLERLLERY